MRSLISKTFLTLLSLMAVLMVFALSGKPPVIGWPSFALPGILWGALLTIIVVWRGQTTAVRPFSRVMRVMRGFVWVFHCICFTTVVVYLVLTKKIILLVLAVPSVLVFLFLSKTAKPKEDPTAVTATDNSVESLTAFYQNYTTQHQAEMDAFARQFRTLLVEKYGFREEFVQAESYTAEVLPDVSAFAVWHHKGKTPEEMAKQIFNDMCFSRDANNPAIFARHVDTGEELPADYDYTHWQNRYLGRTPQQKIAVLIMLPIALAFFYALVFITYLPSDIWYYTSLGMSIALTVAIGVSVYNRWKAGRLLTQPGKRKLKVYDLIWMPPFAVFTIWFTLVNGVGGVITEFAGTPHTAVYTYKKTSSKPCLHIGEGFSALNKFCLRREAHNTLPKESRASFSGRETWFGVSLDVMEGLR